MAYLQNVSRILVRALLFPVRHVVIPAARFVHLGVTLNAQDDAFWAGVYYLFLVKSFIWLVEHYLM